METSNTTHIPARSRAASLALSDSTTPSSQDSWEAEQHRLAQEEWDEGMRQLHLAVTVMLLPFLGKWMGRKWAYMVTMLWLQLFKPSSFTRWQTHGLSFHSFGLGWVKVPTTIIPGPAAAMAIP